MYIKDLFTFNKDGGCVKIRVPAATFDGILIADCERHRTLYSMFEAVFETGHHARSQNRFDHTIQVLSFGTIVNGNAMTSGVDTG
jgi:hypothetical protein